MFRPPRSRSTADGASASAEFSVTDEELDWSQPCTGGSQSGYYTDLLVNGIADSQGTDQTSETVNIEGPTPTTGKSSRGSNFSSEEDILLVSAWLNVNMDGIQGVDQSHGRMWARIHEYFHANKEFDSSRTQSALVNCWSSIQADVNAFCRCVTKIEERSRSGTRVHDTMAEACQLFKAEKHKKFQVMHCWNILKDQPKWLARRKEINCAKKPSTKKQKTMHNSSDAPAPPAAPDVRAGDAQTSVRPAGRKKEKQRLKHGRAIEAVDYLVEKKKEADLERDLQREERWKTAFAVQQEKIKLDRGKFEHQSELDRAKFEHQRELDEDKVMSMDLSTMTLEEK